MNNQFLLTMFFLFSIYIPAQDVKVRFNVASPKLNDSESVYITGLGEKLENWDPSAVKLNKQKDNTWKIEISFPQESKLEYKFTLGSWGKEALNDRSSRPDNSHLTVNKDTVVSVVINK